ncbi:MAG: hypothetical protein DME55_06310 [Verrucomicrobia bacterium]|nr:MAG: hypothetical protein DME55_06310 [Verrucomicrobiota bacterium]
MSAPPFFIELRIDFPRSLKKTAPRHAARYRVLESGNGSAAPAAAGKPSLWLDPKLAQPHNYLEKIFMREGNIPSAIAQFEEALRLHPDFPEAEENLRMAKGSDNASLTLSPR